MNARLELIAPDDLPEFKPGDDLAAMLARVPLLANDVVVVAQKIVSKAEGRSVRLADVVPSERARELALRVGKAPALVELILRESREVIRASPGVLIVEDHRGFVLANAGVDQSNVDGGDSALLLPENPDASAERLRAALSERVQGRIAVIINDSWGRAWRLGTIGTAIGVAGLPALVDRRGALDRAGRALQVTEIGYADEIAAAASLLMGQAGEGRPVVIVRGFDLDAMHPATPAAALLRSRAQDLFR